MNTLKTRPEVQQAVATSISDEDRCWAKEVSFLADPTGELAMATAIPAAFKKAGYKVFAWGKAISHPCWILRAHRTSAPRFTDRAQLTNHVIELLRSAGVQARKADVTITRNGDAVQVSFLWPLAVRAWRFDEGLGWEPDPFAS